MNEDPAVRFQRVLRENNLNVQLLKPTVRFIEGGGIVIDPPLLQVTDFNANTPAAPVDTAKEEPNGVSGTPQAEANETAN